MAQVLLTVNGRRYDVSCDDGEEAHLFRLAEQIDRRVGSLVANLGQVGEARLLLLASLLLADELDAARTQLARSSSGSAAQPPLACDASPETGEPLGEQLRSLAERIEAMAERLGTQTIAEQVGP